MTAPTITLERNSRIVLASPAELVPADREVAWATGLIRANPLYAWVLGRFVSAGPANANGHIFRAEDLRTANASLANAPLNYLHRPHSVLGSYVGAELVYPTEGPALAGTAAGQPFVESLAAMWRYYFPEEYAALKAFHQAGQLAQSMECIPKTVTCATEGCGLEFAYAGRASETYCAHLAPGTRGAPPRWLNKPHFSAGAIVVPPATPAWRGAQVTEVLAAKAEQLRSAESEGLAEDLYAQVSTALPNLAETDRETVMALLMARTGPAGAPKKATHRPAAPASTPPAGEPHAHVDTDPEETDSPCAICGKAPDSPIHVGMGLMGSVEDGTAAMVALYPPRDVASEMALDASFADRLVPADLHITLAYLGPEAVLHLDRAAVEAVLGPLAGASAPLAGEMGGIGRFAAGYPAGQEKWPLYASLDAPDLPEFRQRLVAALAAAGIPYARNHGFAPHMTLAYVGPDDEPAAGAILAGGLKPVPVTFTDVVLAWGTDRISFPLSAGAHEADDGAGLAAAVTDITARGRREAATIAVFDPVIGRSFTGEQRDKLAKKGHAMGDKSFPIVTVSDLRNAIKLVGKAKDPAAARAHIKRRAKALGAENLIPEGW